MSSTTTIYYFLMCFHFLIFIRVFFRLGMTGTKYFAHRVAPPECSPRLGGSATKRVPDWAAPPKFPPRLGSRAPTQSGQNFGEHTQSAPRRFGDFRRLGSPAKYLAQVGYRVGTRQIAPRLGRRAAKSGPDWVAAPKSAPRLGGPTHPKSDTHGLFSDKTD